MKKSKTMRKINKTMLQSVKDSYKTRMKKNLLKNQKYVDIHKGVPREINP